MKLFGTAGIRLVYPSELNPLIALKIGRAVAELGLSRESVIVHDTRRTSKLLLFSIASGLMSGGINARIVGLAPTPVAAFAARKYKAVGISVTASHNPPEYNGFKFYDPEGFEFTRDIEERIEALAERDIEPRPWRDAGDASTFEEAVREYLAELLERQGVAQRRKLNIVVDCGGGATSQLAPYIIKSLGGIPVTINCTPDDEFLVRSPEPRKDVLESLRDLYFAARPAAVMALDGDGDRLSVVDPLTGFVKQDRLLALYLKLILTEKRGRVIVSVDTGRAIDKVAEEMGAKVERYVLGKTHERVKQLGIENVAMAGEPWKLIDTRWGPWVDGLWQVAILTKLVLEREAPISRILEQEGIPDFPWGRVSYLISPVELRDAIYNEVVDALGHALGEPVNELRIDGVRYEYEDGSWLLIRKSGTESKIRFYYEAPTRERRDEISEKAERALLDALSKYGGKLVSRTEG